MTSIIEKFTLHIDQVIEERLQGLTAQIAEQQEEIQFLYELLDLNTSPASEEPSETPESPQEPLPFHGKPLEQRIKEPMSPTDYKVLRDIRGYAALPLAERKRIITQAEFAEVFSVRHGLTKDQYRKWVSRALPKAIDQGLIVAVRNDGRPLPLTMKRINHFMTTKDFQTRA